MSEAETEGVVVRVAAQYVPERSNPSQPLYFFAYRVTIENRGEAPAQLLSRHWIIRDGHGREEHVRGPGVVGETPRLSPGQHFEYTSFCPLPTPGGSMSGTYRMRRDDGAEFDARVAPFSLMADHLLN
ncbi:MAG: Co2+/Mg2+ efflux protein ApaG [Planctomycetes bacterium]|nr:Co2+/Mg2+ efflux protein ApaG [Planctomycetota bacterium]